MPRSYFDVSFAVQIAQDVLIPSDKMARFSNFSSFIDFYICRHSDVFIPAFSKPFYASVVGERIALGKTQILDPAQATSINMTDYISSYVTRKKHWAYSCFCWVKTKKHWAYSCFSAELKRVKTKPEIARQKNAPVDAGRLLVCVFLHLLFQWYIVMLCSLYLLFCDMLSHCSLCELCLCQYENVNEINTCKRNVVSTQISPIFSKLNCKKWSIYHVIIFDIHTLNLWL